MKYKFLKLSLLLPFLLFSCGEDSTSLPSSPSTDLSSHDSSDSSDAPTLTSITIHANGVESEESYLYVGETVQLSAVLSPEGATSDILWTTSSDAVATVSEDGLVTGVSEGTAIVTATSASLPYIQDTIFINVDIKPEQTGVGSGLTPDDPIFIGHEGGDNIEVYFLEMQQIYSDSLFIKKGNVEVLIDTGYAYDGNYVSDFLDTHMPDGRLDLLMLSHSDEDHIDGIHNAIANVDNISLMVDYGGTGAKNSVRDVRAQADAYHSAYDSVNQVEGGAPRYYLTEDFYVDILNTGNYITSETGNASNPNSVACIFTYHDFKFFTGGDLTTSAEQGLMRNVDLPQVTLFKAHHHGSSGSNSQELLNTLNPKGVGISAARANRYGTEAGPASPNNNYNLNGASGHPHDEAIKRIYNAPLLSQNLNLYWNAVNGTMKFTSDGSDNFTFQGSPTVKGYYDLTLTDGVGVWNEEINDWENKVTGEENLRLHETKIFQFRNLQETLPLWAQEEYFPNN